MGIPIDRGALATEQRHPGSHELDTLGTGEIIDLMVDDHRRVVDAVRDARPRLAAFVDALVPRMRRGGRLIYIGAGTSGRLGVLDAAECPPTFHADPGQVIGIIAGGDTSLRRSSEGLEDDRDGAADALAELALTPGDTLLGIAAGGTTPYVLGALERARDAGTATALLTCVTPVPPPPCELVIHLDTGPELLTGSTRLKAGSATKLALNVITTSLFVQLGKVHSNLMIDVRATNEKLRDRAIRILRTFDPTLHRAAAAEVLDRAGGRLRTAIVMQARGVERVEAEHLIEREDGQVRPLL
jgi:N-acetylmuramic acid 6-phosphate etherase